MRDTEWLPKKTQGKSESQKRFFGAPKVGGKGKERAQIGEGGPKVAGKYKGRQNLK